MTTEELAELMAERPDGIEPTAGSEDLDGFQVVTEGSVSGGAAGLVAHRGVLADNEYVDEDVLRAAIEEHFGFTYAEVAAIYKQGQKTPTQREFRTYIDARLLALSRAGANIAVLADALGLTRLTLDRALARARVLHVEPQIKNPAVTRPCMCFICTDMTAKPRRRRFSESPPHLVGTVNLCPTDYSRGFEQQPGNSAYWAFRRRTR